MNHDLIEKVTQARESVIKARTFLKKVAEGEIEQALIQKTAAATPAPLQKERVQELYEDLAAAHLAKTAEIEPAVEAAMRDPNSVLDTLNMLILRQAASANATASDTEPVRPGKLVKKTASVFGAKENSADRMRRRCEEALARLPK